MICQIVLRGFDLRLAMRMMMFSARGGDDKLLPLCSGNRVLDGVSTAGVPMNSSGYLKFRLTLCLP